MKNKILVVCILILIPVFIISFQWKTNFIMPQTEDDTELPSKVMYHDLELDLDDYIYGVVAAEMPASFHKEALKAQILATRTYTLNKLNKNKDYIFTSVDQAYVTDSELKEKWQDQYEYYKTLLKELVKETKGEIITYNNKPIEAYYFSMSNGYTEDAIQVFGIQEEYLVSVKSELENESLNRFLVEQKMPYSEFANALGLNLPLQIGKIKKDESNRVETIAINDRTYTGIEIRTKLNLRSTDFEIDLEENEISITTKGYGHGVGLSQYGANELAKRGYSYEEIIKYYYTNVEIAKI